MLTYYPFNFPIILPEGRYAAVYHDLLL